jgi:hypothetical protein
VRKCRGVLADFKFSSKKQLADEATLLKFQGYRNISVMREAYPEWVKTGYPVETNRQC